MSKLATGTHSSLVVGDNGRVWTFGRNENGILGTGDEYYIASLPVIIEKDYNGNSLNNIIQCSMHSMHAMILSDNGYVYSFGNNYYGQLGIGNTINRNRPSRMQLISGASKIAQGGYHSLILTSSGNIYSVGRNHAGQLGLGNTNDQVYSQLINYSFSGTPIDIQQGAIHSLVLTNTGKVYSFGGNGTGQLGLGDYNYRTTPTLINYSFNGTPIKIQQGKEYSMILTNTGKVYIFGDNYYGQLGLGDYNHRNTPTLINYSFNGKPINIQQGHYNSFIATDTNKIYGFGWNSSGQLGIGNTVQKNTPTLVNKTFNGNIIDISQGTSHSLVLTDMGNVYGSGSNSNGQLGLGTVSSSNNVFVDIFNVNFVMYSLVINQNISNAGTIQINNQTISTPYSNEFDENTNITIKQIPATGYHFVNWSGDLSGTELTKTFTITNDMNIQQNFEINTYTVNITVNGNGSVTGQGTYNHGQTVTIQQTPGEGYHFVNWSGDLTGSELIKIFTITSNMNIVQNFEINTYEVNITIDGNGTVNKIPNKSSYEHNEILQLEQIPDTGYKFVNWTGDLNSINEIENITITSDVNITQHFELAKKEIKVIIKPPEGGTVIGAGIYDYGSEYTLQQIPNEGYKFVGWIVGECED